MKLRLLPFLLAAASLLSADCCCFSPEAIFYGQGGNFRGGGGVEGWLPIAQSPNRVLFFQGGGGYFRHQGVGSLGIGYRQLCRPQLAFGVNGFGDVSFSEHGYSYGQLGGGIEILTCKALFRANGYAPFGHRRTFFSEPGVTTNGIQLIDLDLFRFEVPLPGFDLEVGGELDVGPGELWGYAGYFWHKRGGIRAVQGPRFRAEYRYDVRKLRAQLVLGGWYEHDHLHGSTASVALEVRFPICGRSACRASVCDLMGRRVVRDRAIWIDDFAGVQDKGPLNNLIFANELINGVGTQTDPATIDNAFALSGPGDIVFLLQDTGDMTPAGTITLDPFEQVLGFGDGSEVTIKVANGATLTITDLTGAGRGVVDGVGTIFMTDSNNLLQGIELLNGTIGILMPAGFEQLRVKDVIFTDQSLAGIASNGGSFFVSDSQFDVMTEGIASLFTSGIQEIRRSTFTAPDGIRFEDAIVDWALVSDCEFSTTLDAVQVIDSGGIFVVNRCTINGGDVGVRVDDNVAPGIIKDVRVLNTQMFGLDDQGIDVFISEAADTYVFNNNRLVGISDEAIRMDLDLGPLNVEIIGNELNSFTDEAILMTVTASANILIERNFGTSVVSDQFIDVDFGGPANQPGNVTMLCNRHLNSTNPGVNSYRVDRSSGSQPVCATLLGNNKVVTTNGILIDSNATPLLVFDLPNLSANNNGLAVTLLPTVDNTPTRCPLPTIPPLPFSLDDPSSSNTCGCK